MQLTAKEIFESNDLCPPQYPEGYLETQAAKEKEKENKSEPEEETPTKGKRKRKSQGTGEPDEIHDPLY